MAVFDAAEFDDHEQVLFINDKAAGLRAIVAVHSTGLGPALGGCRVWPYENEVAALRDVLRLSRGMTYKAAMAKVALGGGKSVVIADSRRDKTPELMQAMGRWIDSLGGRYITGEDIGTNPRDMAEIRKQTKYVSCLEQRDGGYGDPAPMTALGVFQAITAGAEKALGTASLSGVPVAVQGIGNVGYNLCSLLHDAGARVTVCDIDERNLERACSDFGVSTVAPDAIFDVDAAIFAPCAMGAVLNDDTIPKLRAKVVAGAANNQLAEQRHGEDLAARGICYLPDYVANGGGLMSCAAEWCRHDAGQVEAKVRGILDTCREILAFAADNGLATHAAADRLAEQRFKAK